MESPDARSAVASGTTIVSPCALLMASSVSIVLKATGSDNGRWNTATAKSWDRGTSK